MKNGGLLKHRHILDNHDRKVVEYLSENLSTAKVFRLVSAYFTIYGYEALQNELCEVEDIRFLFGDPASVGEIDPGKKEQKSFTLMNVKPYVGGEVVFLPKVPLCGESGSQRFILSGLSGIIVLRH